MKLGNSYSPTGITTQLQSLQQGCFKNLQRFSTVNKNLAVCKLPKKTVNTAFKEVMMLYDVLSNQARIT